MHRYTYKTAIAYALSIVGGWCTTKELAYMVVNELGLKQPYGTVRLEPDPAATIGSLLHKDVQRPDSLFCVDKTARPYLYALRSDVAADYRARLAKKMAEEDDDALDT